MEQGQTMTISSGNRKAYRKASPRHVVTFEANMTEDQKRHCFAISNRLRIAGNKVAEIMKDRLESLMASEEYKSLQKTYGEVSQELGKVKANSPDYKHLKSERKKIGDLMDKAQLMNGISQDATREVMKQYAPDLKLNSQIARKRADDVWMGVRNVLYGNGKTIHFKPRGDLPAITAVEATSAIPIHVGKDGHLEFSMNGVGDFGIIIPEMDYFLQDEEQAIVNFLRNPALEDECVLQYKADKTVIPVFRPCYAAIICKEIRHRLRVYVQICVADEPCRKLDRWGRTRHISGKGRVGVDLGPQSFASVSNSEVSLSNLAERNGKCTKCHEERKAFLKKAMDRSRRGTNPERFNKNGTYKKGTKGKWKESNHYRNLRYELRELERKDAESRLYSIRTDANKLREEADVCIIEEPNASRLAKRSLKTERQETETEIVSKDGTVKKVKKYKRKKRFGKSIHHRCPGEFQAELANKFRDGYHVVPKMYRASQYDHILDDYIKKKLSERWHTLPDGKRIQRDIYSAFLLYCADENFKAIDRQKCIDKFDEFWIKHNKLIETIIKNGLSICNSGISFKS